MIRPLIIEILLPIPMVVASVMIRMIVIIINNNESERNKKKKMNKNIAKYCTRPSGAPFLPNNPHTIINTKQRKLSNVHHWKINCTPELQSKSSSCELMIEELMIIISLISKCLRCASCCQSAIGKDI